MRHIAVASAVGSAALVFPGVALAHVGKGAPVATDFTARISGAVPGVRARVVDGDQMLWLAAGPHSVVVRGVQGEPVLRFDRRGVSVNLRSLTAEADRIDRYDLLPATDARASPVWHRLTTGHTYAWHECRLHLLEALARKASGAARLGGWSVPLIVDGRRQMLRGVLDYTPPPSGWEWILIAAAIGAVVAGAAWTRRRSVVPLAVAAILIVWALRIGRGAYGRPTVTWEGWLDVYFSSLVGVLLLSGLLRRDRGVRTFVAFLVGFGAAYQGVTMFGVLTHSIALGLIPTGLARIGVALTLGLGEGLVVGSWPSLSRDHQNEVDERASELVST
jgi:hypothetical protein